MDFLQVSASERVDVDDLTYAISMSQINASRISTANILTSNTNVVVNGFRATNPTGTKTISVTCGTAILSWRQGSVIVHGMTMAPPDGTGGTAQQLSQTLDVSSYVAGTYYVWIRFNFSDAAYAGRTFWTTQASGSEFSQSTPTRTQAVWEMRVDANNPGSEWLQIASVAITAGGVVGTVTDTRPLFYEGAGASPTYISTWGSGTNDRNADRSTYGVADLKTFVDAMHTCLEDIKGGPGYARWYDPYPNRIRVGDASFYMQGINATAGYSNPGVYFNGSDTTAGYLTYNRTSRTLIYTIGGVNAMNVGTTGAMYLYAATTTASPYVLNIAPANTGIASRMGFLNSPSLDTLTPLYVDIGGTAAAPNFTLGISSDSFFVNVRSSQATPIYYNGNGSVSADVLTLTANQIAISTGQPSTGGGMTLNRYGLLTGKTSAANRAVAWNADQIVLSAATVTKNNSSFYNAIGTGYPYQSIWTSAGTINGVTGMYYCRVYLTGTSIPANCIVQATCQTAGYASYGAVVPTTAGANYIDFYFNGLVVFSYTVLSAGAYL